MVLDDSYFDLVGSPTPSPAIQWLEISKRFEFNGPAVILVLDISSSSQMIDEFTRSGMINVYQDELIGDLKRDIANIVWPRRILAHPYKFTGDGWIFILPVSNTDGAKLLPLMREICVAYRRSASQIQKRLSSPPSVMGVKFGADVGEIRQMTIYQDREWVGLPINVACRLQGHVDKTTTNVALVTDRVFNQFLAPATGFEVEHRICELRKIQGKQACAQIRLL